MSELRRVSRREFLKRTGQAGGLVFALTLTASCGKKTVPVPVAAVGSAVTPVSRPLG